MRARYARYAAEITRSDHSSSRASQVYDTNISGTLSLSELTQIFSRSQPAHMQQRVVERTEAMWAEIRARCAEHDDWLSFTSNEGLRLDELIEAINAMPPVRAFFQSVLCKVPPAALGTSSFGERLHTLKAQMHKEQLRKEEAQRKEAASLSPPKPASPARGAGHRMMGGSKSLPALRVVPRASAPRRAAQRLADVQMGARSAAPRGRVRH